MEKEKPLLGVGVDHNILYDYDHTTIIVDNLHPDNQRQNTLRLAADVTSHQERIHSCSDDGVK